MKYILKYLEYLKVVKKDSSYTINSYRIDLEEFYDFYVDLLKIDERIVSNYLEYLYSRKLNRSSIARKISSLRGFYQYLLKEGLVSVNYFREVSVPKRNEGLPKFVRSSDIEKLFSVFDKESAIGQRNSLILEMLYATGVRVSELVNIKLSDINRYDKTIKILGKGRKERVVVYGSYCEKAMELYLNSGRYELEKRGKSTYLFLNKNGERLSDRYVRKIIDDVVRKCELDYHISPHTLRHTFATDMINNGADLMTVKELLGHSSVNTTGIYTHVSSERLKRVYEFAHPRSKM